MALIDSDKLKEYFNYNSYYNTTTIVGYINELEHENNWNVIDDDNEPPVNSTCLFVLNNGDLIVGERRLWDIGVQVINKYWKIDGFNFLKPLSERRISIYL